MIRVRKSNGAHYDIPIKDVPFVEIVNDLDGTVGRLFIQSEPGQLVEVFPNTNDAQRYEALMSKHGVRFAEMIIHKKQ